MLDNQALTVYDTDIMSNTHKGHDMKINEAVQRHLDITAAIKELSAERSALGEAITSHADETGETFVVGTEDDHGLKVVDTVRWTLDQKLVKEEMGEDWVISHSKQGLVRSLRLSRDK